MLRDCPILSRPPPGRDIHRSHCKRGHAMVGANLKRRLRKGRVLWECKQCINAAYRARYALKKGLA